MKSPFIAALFSTFLAGAQAEELPPWAYPPLLPYEPSRNSALLSVPGSDRQYTQGEIDSGYKVADWFPAEHPPMSRVVAAGGPAAVRACAMCHLPNGAGHPESADLAGLPAAYAIAQLRAFKSGTRTGPRAGSMASIAAGISDQDLRASAEYFAQLKSVVWSRIVESATAPMTRLGLGAVRYRADEGSQEPLGERIISVPEDDKLALRRDDHSGFVEFVPPGSVTRGKALVERSMSGINCATCHGPSLTGQGEIPPIAGRLALVTFRALNDISLGYRTTPGALAMRASVPQLGQGEMIAMAAYLASLPPK